MEVLVFGAAGQLGSALRACAGETLGVIPAPRAVDIADRTAVAELLDGHRVDAVINAAAMTHVDAAEVDPMPAIRANTAGPATLALSCRERNLPLVHVSTEAVYRGDQPLAYREGDACDPVSAYGISKLAGDLLVCDLHEGAWVVRTSWLYSAASSSNFPHRLRAQLQAHTRPIPVVTDVVGNPTPADLLAEAILELIPAAPAAGVYHVCCREPASKYDWAVVIAESLGYPADRIEPTDSTRYRSAARRPAYVDLDCGRFRALGLTVLPTWQEAWQAGADAYRRDPTTAVVWGVT
ncbi:MAG: SDR family oxidoreductase [Actinomycetales bacterium]|nr:SDR family oxidoreductase [Actinomycetales bacterium]